MVGNMAAYTPREKFAYQAWIKVFTAHAYPNVFPQSILIRSLSSSTIQSAIVYALVSYTIHAFTIV